MGIHTAKHALKATHIVKTLSYEASHSISQYTSLGIPSKHTTSQQRLYNDAATSRCSDVVTTLLGRCVFAWYKHLPSGRDFRYSLGWPKTCLTVCCEFVSNYRFDYISIRLLILLFVFSEVLPAIDKAAFYTCL